MATDRDDDPFLEGLTGRPKGGASESDPAARREGERLRQALLPDDQNPAAPPWGAVLAREAANDARPRRWLPAALAAGLCTLALGLWVLTPGEDSQWRGGPGAGPAATASPWRSANPRRDAESLAADLRALGSTVSLREGAANEWWLVIEAPPSAQRAVDQRLAPLETALDADGRLVVRVYSHP